MSWWWFGWRGKYFARKSRNTYSKSAPHLGRAAARVRGRGRGPEAGSPLHPPDSPPLEIGGGGALRVPLRGGSGRSPP